MGENQTDGEKRRGSRKALSPSEVRSNGGDGGNLWVRKNNGASPTTKTERCWRVRFTRRQTQVVGPPRATPPPTSHCLYRLVSAEGRLKAAPTSRPASSRTLISSWKILQRLSECGTLTLKNLGGSNRAALSSQKAFFCALLQTGVDTN